MNFEILAIDNHNPQSVDTFYQVQSVIYSNDPLFIHPLRNDVETVFNPSKNKYFENGNAIRWVVYNNGQLAGRIAAFWERKGEKLWGGWGFFECINNAEVSAVLIEKAEAFLRDAGCTKIQAPVNFGDRDAFWGLCIQAKHAPTYLENYNPSYYQQLIEDMGYGVEFEQSTYDITPQTFNIERFSQIASRFVNKGESASKFLDIGQLEKYSADFVRIYNEAWSHHVDFVPLTQKVLLKRFKTMRWAMYEEFAIFAYHKGRPIGFYINILELNQVFKDFRGKMNWWNQLKFIMRRKQITKAKGIIFGVVPDYQNLGIETGMIMKMYEGIKKYEKISSIELAWIGSFNPKMLSMLKSLGAIPTKLHYTYFKEISASSVA